ncbi:MAG: Trm112 family protein [Phyllobacteriaceae bacterium]|nr:Trm112 family protein [Phyllobacteriaceae bacterium]
MTGEPTGEGVVPERGTVPAEAPRHPIHGNRTIDPKLLELLVCPLTKGPLDYDEAARELISRKAKLRFPVRDGIPILLADEALPVED